MTLGIAIAVAAGGLVLGLLLNPLITMMATDPNGAKPLPPAPHPLLGGPAWVGAAVALLTGAMALVLYRQHGPSLRLLYWLAGSVALIIIGAVDWKVRLIDVLFVLGATIAAGVGSVWLGVGGWLSLIGAVAAMVLFGFFFILARFMFPGPGVPFGLGDVYLAMFIGAFVGILDLFTAIFYGMLMAGAAALIVLGARQMGKPVDNYIPYGTFLCLGVLLFLALNPM